MSDDRTLALKAQIPPDVSEMAALIKAMLPNGSKLSDQEAIAGAMYGKVHGLDPFKGEFFIIPNKGIFPGYRGEMRMNEAREYYTQTRSLRGDEAAEHEIMPGDTARIVELYQPDLMARMRTMGVQYQPIAGVGIVRKSEKYKSEDWVGEYPNKRKVKLDPPLPIDPPTGRSWAWKAEQRALKDAMRHMQGGADILNETVDMQLEAAEQHADELLAEVRSLPPAEQQAQFAATVTAMRGDPERNPFDDDPRPTIVVAGPSGERLEKPLPPTGNGRNGHDEPASDAEFRKLTSATQERAAQQPTTNGKPPQQASAPKLAAIKTKDFFDLATAFAAQHPAWQDSKGDADNSHICANVAKLGYTDAEGTWHSYDFTEINAANLVEVFNKLEAHALSKEADAA